MLPTIIKPNEMHSQEFKNEFARGERHLVCQAINSLSLFNDYAVERYISNADANNLIRKSQDLGRPMTCYDEFEVAMTILPLSLPNWVYERNFETRTDYVYRAFIARSIKEVFKINREIVKAQKLSFMLEPCNYNNNLAIEFIYHNATALNIEKDEFLEEVSFIDTSLINI